MITGEIKNKIDSIWDDFFSAGMSEYLFSKKNLEVKNCLNNYQKGNLLESLYDVQQKWIENL